MRRTTRRLPPSWRIVMRRPSRVATTRSRARGPADIGLFRSTRASPGTLLTCRKTVLLADLLENDLVLEAPRAHRPRARVERFDVAVRQDRDPAGRDAVLHHLRVVTDARIDSDDHLLFVDADVALRFLVGRASIGAALHHQRQHELLVGGEMRDRNVLRDDQRLSTAGEEEDE